MAVTTMMCVPMPQELAHRVKAEIDAMPRDQRTFTWQQLRDCLENALNSATGPRATHQHRGPGGADQRQAHR